ncbi:MAG: hypothetical protein EB068_01310 [Betaproteobacteria bacterium]|nr:hypothetical protein [Betaproteobacteria bacterium]
MTVSQRLNGTSYLTFRKELEDRGIVFSYSGYLNEVILSGIGNALRTKMTIDQTDAKVSRAVFSTFVEQVQNVIRYSAETTPPVDEEPLHGVLDDDGEPTILPYGLVVIGEYPDGTRFVTCCNMVRSTDTQKLRNQLDSIRGLDRKELGALMRQQLKDGPPEGSKGAGVGFISMAREANGKWEYDIVESAKDDFDLFCFEAHF